MNKCVKCGKEGNDRVTCSLEGCKYSFLNINGIDLPRLHDHSSTPNGELRKAKEYTANLEQFKPKPNKMKKLLGALKRTITGENKTGELIHGVLDLFPIPNQAVAKGVRALVAGNESEAVAEFRKLLTLRNAMALLGSVAYFAGWISLEDLKAFVEFVVSFMQG